MHTNNDNDCQSPTVAIIVQARDASLPSKNASGVPAGEVCCPLPYLKEIPYPDTLNLPI